MGLILPKEPVVTLQPYSRWIKTDSLRLTRWVSMGIIIILIILLDISNSNNIIQEVCQSSRIIRISGNEESIDQSIQCVWDVKSIILEITFIFSHILPFFSSYWKYFYFHLSFIHYAWFFSPHLYMKCSTIVSFSVLKSRHFLSLWINGFNYYI